MARTSPLARVPARPTRKQRNASATFLPGVVDGERVVIARVRQHESEAALMHRIMIAVSTSGALVWRNHVGRGRHASGNYVAMGLGKGSADIIGLVPPHGRWIAIEVKTKAGIVSPDQQRWLELVRRWGGVTGVARSVEDALALVEEARGHRPAAAKPGGT